MEEEVEDKIKRGMNRKKAFNLKKKIPTSYLRGRNISQICRLKKAQKIGEKEKKLKV